ncbi:MAG TPA: hypothetical protein VEL04_05485 [Burkholderiales bacterium]|nr:hypothetical protein [Burkholderiales bacterium]
MNRSLLRRVSLWLIAVLAFAQASVATAACQMDRGGLTTMLEVAHDFGCETQVKPYFPQYPNRCIAHCTVDLQLSGLPAALVQAPADAAVLLLPRVERRGPRSTGLDAAPPGAAPPRILLHSFLI